MAHSRLERIGTIYSRVTGLIKSGAMKLEERPLWYNVYEAFPPKTPPVYDQKISDKPIRNIFYPEDKIRALFYKRMSNSPIGRMDDHKRQTMSQKCISSSLELAAQNQRSLEEAFETVFAQMQEDMAQIRTNVKESLPPSLDSEKEKPSIPDLKDIFKSS